MENGWVENFEIKKRTLSIWKLRRIRIFLPTNYQRSINVYGYQDSCRHGSARCATAEFDRPRFIHLRHVLVAMHHIIWECANYCRDWWPKEVGESVQLDCMVLRNAERLRFKWWIKVLHGWQTASIYYIGPARAITILKIGGKRVEIGRITLHIKSFRFVCECP